MDRANEMEKEGNYSQAVLAYRTWATQYKIWHEEHTVPFFKARPVDADGLMKVDIEAAISIFSSLSHCLMKDNRSSEIEQVLQKAGTFIDDPRYRFCLACLRGLRFVIAKDFDSAVNALKGAPDFDPERIVDLEYGRFSIRLFVDILWTQLPLERTLKILDCLLASEKDPLLGTEARVHKGLVLYVYKDKDSAFALLKSALDLAETVKPTNNRERVQLHLAKARAYEQIVFVRGTRADGLLAIDEYQKAFEIVEDKEDHASLHQHIGQVYDFIQDFEHAEEHFEKATQISSDVTDKGTAPTAGT